jgi:hypothetical protein
MLIDYHLKLFQKYPQLALSNALFNKRQTSQTLKDLNCPVAALKAEIFINCKVSSKKSGQCYFSKNQHFLVGSSIKGQESKGQLLF